MDSSNSSPLSKLSESLGALVATSTESLKKQLEKLQNSLDVRSTEENKETESLTALGNQISDSNERSNTLIARWDALNETFKLSATYQEVEAVKNESAQLRIALAQQRDQMKDVLARQDQMEEQIKLLRLKK